MCGSFSLCGNGKETFELFFVNNAFGGLFKRSLRGNDVDKPLIIVYGTKQKEKTIFSLFSFAEVFSSLRFFISLPRAFRKTVISCKNSRLRQTFSSSNTNNLSWCREKIILSNLRFIPLVRFPPFFSLRFLQNTPPSSRTIIFLENNF